MVHLGSTCLIQRLSLAGLRSSSCAFHARRPFCASPRQRSILGIQSQCRRSNLPSTKVSALSCWLSISFAGRREILLLGTTCRPVGCRLGMPDRRGCVVIFDGVLGFRLRPVPCLLSRPPVLTKRDVGTDSMRNRTTQIMSLPLDAEGVDYRGHRISGCVPQRNPKMISVEVRRAARLVGR